MTSTRILPAQAAPNGLELSRSYLAPTMPPRAGARPKTPWKPGSLTQCCGFMPSCISKLFSEIGPLTKAGIGLERWRADSLDFNQTQGVFVEPNLSGAGPEFANKFDVLLISVNLKFKVQPFPG